MKRLFDIFLSVCLILFFMWLIVLITLAIRLTSKGAVIYWSSRIGKNNYLFQMPKFRSMQIDTPEIATHLMSNPKLYLSPVGGFLRSSSLDELPQLFSVLKGDMSFVGPRPALHNQDDLAALRSKKGIDKLVPGITGWAQVNGRDDLSIPEKVGLDLEYLNYQSFWFDLKILWMTFLKVIGQNNISH